MARAKILQDIDKELDLVERESSKLRKKQAELDEEEKEIDAKLRWDATFLHIGFWFVQMSCDIDSN